MTFPSTHPALALALVARNYSIPTAVQLAVLEPNALNRDLLVSAQTGSGKTVAFGLAMATSLLGDAERFERAGAPLALIIAPTRELAMQVQRELAWLYETTGARVVTCVGGMDVRAEARQLSAGAHIVVGTPGRLRDHLERKRLDLAHHKAIVLDEADEMLDLGFREDLEYILDATPEGRRTLLFSATMPREIETMARRYQSEAVRIETLRRDEQHADIEYSAIRVAPNDVEHAVVNVLRFHEMRAALVFCSTREAVKRLHSSLVERGFSAVALSGELTQHERTQALQALRDGRARVLVATDVAARGLDLPDLALVIHADLPNDRETLLHRSGRTGRAGRKGLCVLIVPYNRRRKADTLLGAAKLKITWGTAPTADAIRVRDQERFLADAMFTDTATEDDLVLARGLQTARTPDEIALALIRIRRDQLPAPEDLAEDSGPPRRDDRQRFDFKPRERDGSSTDRPARDGAPRDRERFERRPDRGPDRGTNRGPDRANTADRPERSAERTPRPPRDDPRDMVWFRLNIGRDRNADPRWLLPLICRAGGVSKAEIGSIKIFDRDTRFQIVAEFADQFADTVRTAKTKEGHISRVGANTPNADAAEAEAVAAFVPATSDKPKDRPHRPSPPPAHSEASGRSAKPAAPREAAKDYKPARDAASKDGPARDSQTRDRPKSDPKAGPKAAPKSPSKAPWSKTPWQDRKKPDGGPRPHRKGTSHGSSTLSLASAPSRPAGPGATARPGGQRPSSKFGYKKKHGAPPPSKP